MIDWIKDSATDWVEFITDWEVSIPCAIAVTVVLGLLSTM